MKKQLIIILVTAFILVSSLFVPKEVQNDTEMKSVSLGYPFPYFVQDFSRFTPLYFPQKFSFGSPWEDPAKILWVNFTLSFVSVLLTLNILYLLVNRYKSRQGKCEDN